MIRSLLFILAALPGITRFTCAAPAQEPNQPAPIVVNEIMYHPPGDRDDLQFIELFNRSSTAVDLSGWKFTQGIEFTFPRGFILSSQGYTVLCRNLRAFQAFYGHEVPVAGVFQGKLSHNGEQLQFADAQSKPVDALKYTDESPWPAGADGLGPSLERICPLAPSNHPANWAASNLKGRQDPAGSPGRQNTQYSAHPLPEITDVHFANPAPNQPLTVSAKIMDPAGVQSVTLSWWVSAGAPHAVWNDIPMKPISGDSKQGVFSATIPGQLEARLIRFAIRALSSNTAERVLPAKNEPRPTFSAATFTNTNSSHVPFVQVLTLGVMQPAAPSPFGGGGPRRRQIPQPTTEKTNTSGSALIYFPPGASQPLLFDHVQVRPRRGGWKIRFQKDQPLNEMSAVNLVFEFSPRFVLAEALAYEVYRRAGVPAPQSFHARTWIDQRPQGYFLLVEQPNKSFLRRHKRDPDGNLYKVVWYGQGVVGAHEKKSNPHLGHADIIETVDRLNQTSGAAQWDYIQKNFNVDQFASYYAVNMCIQNWDGFFNNHYVYKATTPGARWEVYPWDEDKTWGDYDGASWKYDWYEMPLNFGMNGEGPSRSMFGGGGPFGGGASWWRPPGHFSGPLLANPEFRKRFLARLQQLCQTVFTPEKLHPVINSLENKLLEEVKYRAQIINQNPSAAVKSFHSDIESFRNQVIHRRKFILNQLNKAQD